MRGDSWQWDETLYAGSADWYAAGRLPYPPAVAETVARELALDGTERLLDIGCGPGSLTLLLAPWVAAAVGIDADAEMISAAEGAAARAGVHNVSWRRLRAEDLPSGLGRFQLATFAQSFHWMDRPLVAAAVHQLLEPGGACLIVHATTHRGDDSNDPLPHPRPPHEAIAELISRYLGSVRRAGRGTLPTRTPSGEDDVMRRAGFQRAHRVDVDVATVVTRNVDAIVASVFSLSSATPHLFGSQRGEFEQALRRLLRTISPEGLFAERTRDIALEFWRS